MVILLVFLFIFGINIVSAADINENSTNVLASQNMDLIYSDVDGYDDVLADNSSKVSTEISVENVVTKAGSNITIPINVSSADGMPLNCNVTALLPDGTNQIVNIINGNGNVGYFIPEDYSGEYDFSIEFLGNENYLPSTATGLITIPPKIPVQIFIRDINAKPGENINIPIYVVPYYGLVFNGNIVVELPDGSTKILTITNGFGTVDWTVPIDYNGTFNVTASFEGNDTYLAANGTGFIFVSLDSPQSTQEGNQIQNNVNAMVDKNATGNPIMVLLMVLALLGINIKRKQ